MAADIIAEHLISRSECLKHIPRSIFVRGEPRELILEKIQNDFMDSTIVEAAKDAELCVSHLEFPWKTVLRMYRQQLSENGLLLFSSLGVDSFQELRALNMDIPDFSDLHDIGDYLVSLGFLDPVIDQEHLMLRYQTSAALKKDLSQFGIDIDTLPTMLLQEKYDEPFSLTLEVIYGVALGSNLHQHHNGEISIPIHQIKKEMGHG